MAKYRVSLRVEFQQGIRPAETEVTWSCTRLPHQRIHGGEVERYQGERRRPEELGEMYGIYHAMKHAEQQGEALAPTDIEVAYESLTHVFKRKKIERSLQGPSLTRTVSQSIFDEVNARPRPL